MMQTSLVIKCTYLVVLLTTTFEVVNCTNSLFQITQDALCMMIMVACLIAVNSVIRNLFLMAE